jgi:Fe/S biogenesis protein NfuA
MMTDDTPVDAEPILAITERAGARIRTFLTAGEGEPKQAVWVEITGIAGDAYTYNLTLLPPSTARPGDAVQRIDDLVVVVGRNDREHLRGATVDWIDTATGGGLTVLNPNKPPPPPKARAGLPMSLAVAPPASPAVGNRPSAGRTGSLEQRVIAVLEQEINPAIAQHGGRAELVAIEAATAYLRLGGGCQGCGMATVTLTQGIAVSITEAVPEIDRVVDVTDHSSGTNPYYEQAKK